MNGDGIMSKAILTALVDYNLRQAFDAICFALGKPRTEVISLLLKDFVEQSGLMLSDETLDECMTPPRVTLKRLKARSRTASFKPKAS